MSRSTRSPKRPNVVIRRRPSDFLGRGTVLLQSGCFGTCCCCCCLHWIGAAIGGTGGILAALPAQRKEPDSRVRRISKGHLLWAAWLAALAAAALLVIVLTDWTEVLWLAGPAVILFTAAAGGVAGMLAAYRARTRERGRPVHPIARKYVLGWTWLGLLGTAAFITATAVWISNTTSAGAIRDVTEIILGLVVYVPSLVFLPVGAAALIGAVLARWIHSARRRDPAERKSISAGLGLAWRIAWMSFVWSTFLSGVGYLAMYVIALFLD